jgi:hypothetical protein
MFPRRAAAVHVIHCAVALDANLRRHSTPVEIALYEWVYDPDATGPCPVPGSTWLRVMETARYGVAGNGCRRVRVKTPAY